jgi:hypothetical protein
MPAAKDIPRAGGLVDLRAPDVSVIAHLPPKKRPNKFYII